MLQVSQKYDLGTRRKVDEKASCLCLGQGRKDLKTQSLKR